MWINHPLCPISVFLLFFFFFTPLFSFFLSSSVLPPVFCLHCQRAPHANYAAMNAGLSRQLRLRRAAEKTTRVQSNVLSLKFPNLLHTCDAAAAACLIVLTRAGPSSGATRSVSCLVASLDATLEFGCRETRFHDLCAASLGISSVNFPTPKIPQELFPSGRKRSRTNRRNGR